MLAGARISFLVGFTVVIVSSAVGTLLGAVAGYFGGRVDDVISRVIDTLLAFPGLLLAIALVAVLGPSLANVLFALTIIGWVGLCAAGARAGAARARVRVRAGGARARRGHGANPVEARHPDRDSRGRRAGDARHGRRDHRRSVAEFSRSRRSAADAELGHDAQRRPRAHPRCAAPDAVSGARHRAAGARSEFPGRRSPRPHRSTHRIADRQTANRLREVRIAPRSPADWRNPSRAGVRRRRAEGDGRELEQLRVRRDRAHCARVSVTRASATSPVWNCASATTPSTPTSSGLAASARCSQGRAPDGSFSSSESVPIRTA